MELARQRVETWRDKSSIVDRIKQSSLQYQDIIQRCGEVYIHLKSDEDRGAILQRLNALRLWSQVKADVADHESSTMPAQVCLYLGMFI
jgi:hypothetical protein